MSVNPSIQKVMDDFQVAALAFEVACKRTDAARLAFVAAHRESLQLGAEADRALVILRDAVTRNKP